MKLRILSEKRKAAVSQFDTISKKSKKNLALLTLFAITLAISGCGSEPKPTIHKKTYTLNELESKYRDIPKRPSDLQESNNNSVAIQKTQFDRDVSNIFGELNAYHDHAVKENRLAAKIESDENKRNEIKKNRDDEKCSALREKENGSLINAYYN